MTSNGTKQTSGGLPQSNDNSDTSSHYDRSVISNVSTVKHCNQNTTMQQQPQIKMSNKAGNNENVRLRGTVGWLMALGGEEAREILEYAAYASYGRNDTTALHEKLNSLIGVGQNRDRRHADNLVAFATSRRTMGIIITKYQNLMEEYSLESIAESDDTDDTDDAVYADLEPSS